MPAPINRFKQALRGERTLFGLWLGIPDATCAEIGGSAGFDFVVVDAEHGPFDVGSVMTHLQALAPYPVAPVVRPPEGQTALLKRLLDVGAQTLLIPMVDSADHAEEIVQACRYPPQGIRGLGTSMARAARWNAIPDYLQTANEQVCVIAQIETRLGLENIAEIADVEGVDAIFIGPSDLSAALGHIGRPDHPEVVEAIHDAFEVVLSANKSPGVLAVAPDLVRSYVERGAKFVGVGVDAALLGAAVRQLAATYTGSSNDGTASGY